MRRGLELLEPCEPLLWQQCPREIRLGSCAECGCTKVAGRLDRANLDWSLQETAQLWVARRRRILDEPDVKKLLCRRIVDSSPIVGLHHLQALHIDIGRKLTEVAPLATLDQLESLTLIGCVNLWDISIWPNRANSSSPSAAKV